MNRDDGTALPADTPVQLGDIDPRVALPSTSRVYLLLTTQRLEDWAYRPSPPDAGAASAVAPSVIELVRALESFAPRRWLWANSPLADMEERGPLLVDATDKPALLEQAITDWSEADGVIIIGTQVDLDTLARHLGSLVQITLPDHSQATFNFQPTILEPWLSALGQPNRSQWLGPIQQLLWRTHWHRRVSWFRLDHPEAASTADPQQRLHLHPLEMAAFDANTQDYFIISLAEEVQALSQYNAFSLEQICESVREKVREAASVNIERDTDVRDFVLLHARYPEPMGSEQAKALLEDPVESPVSRLRNLTALISEKEFQNE
ncbi:DUF4123 domain-containing protein [Pseudomonas sp. 09C 129]|uniref:DUF4123 domain-containing protein n=1 Tax=Pseudomonas sp. 09C 129 TaxID=2054915 RepID=UPI0012FEE6C7|nr:DUF4123 domain-containing protein [Pseudomonas sp. 09C 129]